MSYSGWWSLQCACAATQKDQWRGVRIYKHGCLSPQVQPVLWEWNCRGDKSSGSSKRMKKSVRFSFFFSFFFLFFFRLGCPDMPRQLFTDWVLGVGGGYLANIWATTWQNQQNECAPSEDSDQPGHPLSLIKVFAVRMKKPWALSYTFSAFVLFV